MSKSGWLPGKTVEGPVNPCGFRAENGVLMGLESIARSQGSGRVQMENVPWMEGAVLIAGCQIKGLGVSVHCRAARPWTALGCKAVECIWNSCVCVNSAGGESESRLHAGKTALKVQRQVWFDTEAADWTMQLCPMELGACNQIRAAAEMDPGVKWVWLTRMNETHHCWAVPTEKHNARVPMECFHADTWCSSSMHRAWPLDGIGMLQHIIKAIWTLMYGRGWGQGWSWPTQVLTSGVRSITWEIPPHLFEVLSEASLRSI